MSAYIGLIQQLEAVAADLDDIAFDRLREAVAAGDLARPAEDKRLMQARRAIEKASAILRALDDGESALGQST
jgi:hypothetical protein